MKNLLPLILFATYACNSPEPGSIEQWKDEIVDTEKSFAQMAAEEGMQKAFLHFADEEAVLLRGNQLIKGKTAISVFFENQTTGDQVSLTWEPDFVDVSVSGDLGYTYGSYTFSRLDSTGNKVENEGIFHTVWKRQADGNWRFVWD